MQSDIAYADGSEKRAGHNHSYLHERFCSLLLCGQKIIIIIIMKKYKKLERQVWQEGTERMGAVKKGDCLLPCLSGGGRSSQRDARGRAGTEREAAQAPHGCSLLMLP